VKTIAEMVIWSMMFIAALGVIAIGVGMWFLP
jgi:hypothetical protein